VRKWVVGILLLTCLLAPMAAYAKQVSMSVVVDYEDNRTPVNVFVNGINLDDKIDELESQYYSLARALDRLRLTVADYVMFAEVKNRLLKAYDEKLAEVAGNASEVKRLLEKREATELQADRLMIRILSSLGGISKTTDRGWIDIYGNHRDFDDPEYVINPDFDFRLTDCRSSIGRSAVLIGDELVVKGVLYLAGWSTTRELKVYLIDPESNEPRDLVAYAPQGQNVSFGDASIEWLTPSVFVVRIRTDGMLPGLKQVDVEFEGYTVSCTFVVVKPFIVKQEFGNYTRIVTNYPAIVVNGSKVVYPINGVAWVPTGSEVVGAFT